MANSKFEYVRAFEQPDNLLANTWIVVRVDGRGFSKLTTKYHFTKPNDKRALDLMNAAARRVMSELPDLVIAFVFHKDCTLFERRASKLTTTIVSTFTAAYMHYWPEYLPDEKLSSPLPTFDGRAVCYPGDENLRHYMSWRQVDCHINNLYNTTFWALVQQGGMEPRAAEQALAGTVSSDKNEILFSRFGINYNNEPEIFKKGSVLYRDYAPSSIQSSPTPELAHPKPRQIPRPISQPLERSPNFDSREEEPITTPTPREPIGPTFLSTSTTPSPPPSPPSMSIPTFPFPNAFVPISSHGTGSAATTTKQSLPALKPIPLPPPTLKPSSKPPPSLNRPNPTAHTNTSPLPSPVAPLNVSVPARTTSTSTNILKFTSHSASASLSYARPSTASVSAPKPTLKHRSPSLSLLEGSGPPDIPLRISSIPLNNKTRKLSLPTQKSIGLLPNSENSNSTTTKQPS
ncbi:Thg1 C terminal domain-containing protein [Lophiotrema nucula]|uniref:tRNA(His) guanylyltransferase n=1 Tax=Lophiotrema nucula TaxID=690887 RepID=A0A6A5YJW6_9PLEO|nr:Thg1 C terminal domain-containing protein [Lophiotrema nucula]